MASRGHPLRADLVLHVHVRQTSSGGDQGDLGDGIRHFGDLTLARVNGVEDKRQHISVKMAPFSVHATVTNGTLRYQKKQVKLSQR